MGGVKEGDFIFWAKRREEEAEVVSSIAKEAEAVQKNGRLPIPDLNKSDITVPVDDVKSKFQHYCQLQLF